MPGVPSCPAGPQPDGLVSLRSVGIVLRDGVATIGIVTNTLTDASGHPIVGASVRILLISPANPFLLNGSGEILSQVPTETDATGIWSVTLTPNDQLEQDNTYYLVDETCVPGGVIWPISVPEGAGPFLLRDILVAVPTDHNPGGPVMIRGGSISFHHDQTAASPVWTIPHNLGFRPNVRVKDTAGADWYGWTITDVSLNTLTLDLGVSMAGTAELS